MSEQKWPQGLTVALFGRYRVRPGRVQKLRPETTGMLVAADVMENSIRIFVNPAISYEGTGQELIDDWERVGDDTPLTF